MTIALASSAVPGVAVAPQVLRVAVIADMLEEGWTSMDVVADALLDHLPSQDAWPVRPDLVRASFVPLLGRFARSEAATSTRDRVVNRFWLYRRALGPARRHCSVFHIVDHSYAHLASLLPPGRTIVTCHDIDTFRGFHTADAIDTGLPRFLVNRLVTGLRRAAFVACSSRATARDVVAAGLADAERLVVVPLGVEPPPTSASVDRECAALLGSGGATVDLLHVGSTVPRKRIDLLLEIVARVAQSEPRIRLLRAGAPLTDVQRAQADRLGISSRILELPFLSRGALFGVYRRAAMLLMTSDREGFGLPVIEALSCGLPVIARDLPVLREVGHDWPAYAGDNPDEWAFTVHRVLGERDTPVWHARREAGRAWASQFSWRRYASEMALLYARVAGNTGTDAPCEERRSVSGGHRRSVALAQEPPNGHVRGRSRLRVLHVGKYYPPVPGGMERVLQLLCEGERTQIDARVLVSNTGPRTERTVVNGVPVARTANLATVGSVAVSPQLALELWRDDADLTVIHEPNPVALVADAVTRRRSPLIVYFHSEVVRPEWRYRLAYRPFLTRVLERAARVIVASPAMVDAPQLQGYTEKCVVIPYGIDTARLRATPAIVARARELRARGDVPLVLFAGRLVPYKGVDVLIRAMRDVTARLKIVGDGPQSVPLRTLAAEMDVAGRVEFLGSVPDVELIALYHACDVFVLPSVTRAEAFGIVQIEAMACGKPVISTDLPSGVPWVNRHGETGLVVPPGDAGALSEALAALTADEPLRLRLGTAGRQRVAAEFTAERMSERTVALYRSILNGRGA